MKLSEQLQPNTILAPYPQRSKNEVIQDLVALLCEHYRLQDQEKILQAVMDRENAISTGVGSGLAVPHGKLANIDQMYIAAAVCPAGIDFQSQDKEPARVLFLILSPETTVGPHIRALSCISRLIADAQVRRQLLESTNGEQFLDVLRLAEETFQ